MYGAAPIQEIPLGSPFFRSEVEAFLQANGLRMEALDAYYAIRDSSGAIVAGAGLSGEVVKCVAVSSAVRSEGLLTPLVSRIVSSRPGACLKVFTKPSYQAIFESLGFHLIASAPLAVLLENGRGLEEYCSYLRSVTVPGRTGVVVMNANPFTLGHQYLLSQALKQVDHLYVIPVLEDVSAFPYAERVSMIRAFAASAGLAAEENYFSCGGSKNLFPSAIANLTHADAASCPAPTGHLSVLEGSPYVISTATFPTYFLKDLSTAAETQMQLDLDLYKRWIAPALGVSVRFVGSEPTDALTARYNELIPNAVVIQRAVMPDHHRASAFHFSKNQFSPAIANLTHADAISASMVRAALEQGSFREASALCPSSTWPYLLAALAERALCLELDTPGKPGLVGPDGPGAHKDMDYGIMRRGIAALRPFWSRMVLASTPEALRQAGIEAEEAMLAATGGVNTHRGAIFAFGLMLNAFYAIIGPLQPGAQLADIQQLLQTGVHLKVHRLFSNLLSQNELRATYNVKDARAMADEGYQELFEDWLPYYRSLLTGTDTTSVAKKKADDSSGASAPLQKLLLRIISTLDDTCVIKRVGYERAQEVKREARCFLEETPNQVGGDEEKVRGDVSLLCERYAAEGISPGGAADMLALTIFIDSII
ncbi:MAG: triphosphoribosyl-dephospho-CoA synthase [Bacteroidales bacterium]|nr:triphosphoribosyl-dephospho-CoA synthase [Bacteroidales bacterium]